MILVILRSSIVLLMACIAARLLRRQSAAVRHLIWTAGLVGAVAVSICTPWLPPWLPSWSPDAGGSALIRLDVPGTSPQVEDLSQTVSSVGASSSLNPDLSVEKIVFRIWITGAVLAAIVLLVGVARLARFMIKGTPFTDERWMTAAADVSRSLKLTQRIRLVRHPRLSLLGTWGIGRARVLLPRDAESWSEERVRVVLSHELAHISRFDWLVQVAAEITRACFWFNPLFWLACSRLRIESEHACDDAVLNLGIDPQVYAAHLLELARSFKNSGRAWSPVLAMAQTRNLERRFVAMLNPSLNHRPAGIASVIVVIVAAFGLAMPLAALREPSPAESVLSHGTALPGAVQDAFGSLSGTVCDPSGAVVPGVVVTVSNLQTKSEETTRTGPAGEFEFRRLAAGDYAFTATVPGFMAYRKTPVGIAAGQAVQQTVNLSLGRVSEHVVVKAPGQPKPPAVSLAGTPRRIRVGGNVQVTALISRANPVYPPRAQNAGIEGTVRLEAIIGTDGSLLEVRPLSNIDDDLTAAALDAVRQWRYRPTLLNGEAVQVMTTIDVEFKLVP